MRLLLALLALALGACAGEWGVRLEVPQATLAWLSQEWQVLGLTVSARAEAQLLPLGFRRGTLSLSDTGVLGSWKLEGILLGTGRIDAFLSASFSQSLSVGPASVRLAAGGKAGWAAVNLAPLWLGAWWALAEAEALDWTGKVQWEGPPSAWTLRVAGPSTALSLGQTAILELWETLGDWTLGAQIQIGPKRGQRITVAWASGRRTVRAWLSLEGGGLLFSNSAEGQNLLFSLSWGASLQGVLEITRTF